MKQGVKIKFRKGSNIVAEKFIAVDDHLPVTDIKHQLALTRIVVDELAKKKLVDSDVDYDDTLVSWEPSGEEA